MPPFSVSIGPVAAAVALLASAGSVAALEKATPTAGQTIYDRDCSTCHGAEGKGDGEQATYVTPQPQDFTKGILEKRSDDFLTSVITKGGQAQGLSESMPGFPKLSKADLQSLVAYIRQLGKRSSGQKAK